MPASSANSVSDLCQPSRVVVSSGYAPSRDCKEDVEGTVSPLTPALSPLRGEGEEAAAVLPGAGEGEEADDCPLTPTLSPGGGEGEDADGLLSPSLSSRGGEGEEA